METVAERARMIAKEAWEPADGARFMEAKGSHIILLRDALAALERAEKSSAVLLMCENGHEWEARDLNEGEEATGNGDEES